MAEFAGTWKLEDSENFEQYMMQLGVGLVARKSSGASHPTLLIRADGDDLLVETRTALRVQRQRICLGQPFQETTVDGRLVESTPRLEAGGRRLVLQQSGDFDSTVVRQLDEDGDGFTETLEARGVAATRRYRRVPD